MHKNDKILDLEKKIIDARNDYYNSDFPLISDIVYDAWVDELKALDPTNVILSQVGANVDNSHWEKGNHKIPMGSLDKINLPQEMIDWKNKIAYSDELIVMDKLDGISLDIEYKDGKLVQAITRGDGKIGEIITRNVVMMNGVLKQIPKFTGNLRGEIILRRSNHKKYFSEYANARNAASGISKRLDGVGCQYLDVIFYQVFSDLSFSNKEDQLKFLKSIGLQIPLYIICNNANEVNTRWNEYQESIRDQLDYDIDGCVIEINSLQRQMELDDGTLIPKFSIAYKFAPQSRETILLNIEWQVGGSGRVTPVAIFEPVHIGGSNVQKSTLHNVKRVKDLDIKIGCNILIVKRGDVIPAVEKCIGYSSNNKEIVIPNKCPICDTELEMQGEYLVCPNILTCSAQKSGRIKNWVNTLNLLEWGNILVDNLVESGKVSSIDDLYKLTVNDLASLPRMADKSAQKAYNILWENSSIKLEKFLGGLSIPMVGETIIGIIMDAGYTTLEQLFSMSKQDFEKISGIGNVKANNLYLGLKQNKDLIEKLLSLGLKIKPRIKGKFTNMLFCFTGAGSHNRDDLIESVTKNGGIVKNSVVKNLTYLVCEDTSTVKYKTAKARNIPIISEDEFLSMIDE